MLYLIGIIIAFFLAIVLASKENKSEADKILTVWLLLSGIHLVLYYVFISKDHLLYGPLLGVELPIPLLHGPLLFLYTASLTNQNSKRKYWALHFLPAVFLAFSLMRFYMLSVSEKIAVFANNGTGYEMESLLVQFSTIISGVVYFTWSLFLLKQHRQNIVREFSYLEKVNLAWLRYLIWGIGAIWVFVILGDEEYIFGSVVVYMFFIGYFGIKQVGIFTQQHQLSPTEINSFSHSADAQVETSAIRSELGEEIEKEKYYTSGLTGELATHIHVQLNKVMKEEHMFKNPELTLTQLSTELNVNSNYLSQVINSMEQKNFYDYLNFQRVEEFKKIVVLPESQKYTLLALAYECGFNSKTSFNRNFKNTTGFSPTEFLKQENIKLT